MNAFDLSKSTLHELVREEGIFASSRKGFDGRFHGLFGRDTCISTLLIMDAEYYSSNHEFTPQAIAATYQLANWQGQHDDYHRTGQEKGKIPHEIRLEPKDYQHLVSKHLDRKWFVDPDDGILKNWDSNDSTPLWIITMLRAVRECSFPPSAEFEHRLREALLWCLKNLENCTPLADFEHHHRREFGGLFNQSWKDSSHSYLLDDGSIAPHPIQDIWVNALFYHALYQGAVFYREKDLDFSQRLSQYAESLRTSFRSYERGFRYLDSQGKTAWGEARDGYQNLLKATCIDSALSLYGDSSQGECLFTGQEALGLLERMMASDMFDSQGGIRVYSSNTQALDPLKYHRGAHTFWPFTNGLLIPIFDRYGRVEQATQLSKIILSQIESFGSCIELYLKEGEHFVRYQEPGGHRSSADQTWTAAAGYLAGSYLSSISSKY
jgi:glycogen debranching enzyme